ncbi:MAG: FkbM family methyltransferase [Bryobacteraceae bacterium]
MKHITSTEILCAGQARAIQIFDTVIGRAVSRDVLTGKSYPILPFLKNVRTILDVGGNIGAASVYFALHYPEARVLAFEPDPECFTLLRHNTADLKNVRAFSFGLAGHDAVEPLFLGSIDPATNSLGKSTLNSVASVMVEIKDPRPILVAAGIQRIDILKLDTEGAEVPILHALESWLPRTGVVYVEYHDEAARREIDSLLAATHVLFQGTIHFAHRGELCYVLQERMPAEMASLRIVI